MDVRKVLWACAAAGLLAVALFAVSMQWEQVCTTEPGGARRCVESYPKWISTTLLTGSVLVGGGATIAATRLVVRSHDRAFRQRGMRIGVTLVAGVLVLYAFSMLSDALRATPFMAGGLAEGPGISVLLLAVTLVYFAWSARARWPMAIVGLLLLGAAFGRATHAQMQDLVRLVALVAVAVLLLLKEEGVIRMGGATKPPRDAP